MTQLACPLFVPLAEEGLTEGPIVELVARRYLEPMFTAKDRPECLVLGCTHFPPLAPVIAKIAGRDVRLVDSAETTAIAAERLLKEIKLSRNDGAASPPVFLATDAPERFARVGQIFLGSRIAPASVELVDIS